MHRVPSSTTSTGRSCRHALCVLFLTLACAAAADEEVRCPDCNIEGKMACPDCRGRGEKVEDCRRCQGTGRRPCPRCMQEGSGQLEGGWTALKPGTLNCDLCRGKRFTRREDEPCRRCLGAGAIQCTQCGGKASLACRKQVTMGICPTCRFVGKVSCMTCNGSTLIPPSLLKTRRTLPTPGEIDGRFRDLTSRYKEHFSGLVEDPQECLNSLRKEVSRQVLMMRSRAPRRCTGLIDELEGLLLTVSRVQQRAAKLRDLFRRFEVSYLKARSSWPLTPEAENSIRESKNEKAAEQELKRVDALLRLAEDRARELGREAPGDQGGEIRELQEDWLLLELQAEKELATLRVEAEGQPAKSTIRIRDPVLPATGSGLSGAPKGVEKVRNEPSRRRDDALKAARNPEPQGPGDSRVSAAALLPFLEPLCWGSVGFLGAFILFFLFRNPFPHRDIAPIAPEESTPESESLPSDPA